MIYGPGGILANNFTVGLSVNGNFNVFGERTIDVVVDVSGYYAPPAAGGLYYHPLSKPVRLLDTRAGFGNCDSVNAPIAGGTSMSKLARMTCEGQLIPNNAQAIIGNVTVINQTAQAGYLTLYPTGQAACERVTFYTLSLPRAKLAGQRQLLSTPRRTLRRHSDSLPYRS